MRIKLTSVHVDDQGQALRFYTGVLGFAKKTDIPLGAARWLTVVAPGDPAGTELLLEPDSHPAVRWPRDRNPAGRGTAPGRGPRSQPNMFAVAMSLSTDNEVQQRGR
jgi:catechol 2,3-dioxygenase-like lactoylglutathione lyase family enzyme